MAKKSSFSLGLLAGAVIVVVGGYLLWSEAGAPKKKAKKKSKKKAPAEQEEDASAGEATEPEVDAVPPPPPPPPPEPEPEREPEREPIPVDQPEPPTLEEQEQAAWGDVEAEIEAMTGMDASSVVMEGSAGQSKNGASFEAEVRVYMLQPDSFVGAVLATVTRGGEVSFAGSVTDVKARRQHAADEAMDIAAKMRDEEFPEWAGEPPDHIDRPTSEAKLAIS